MSDENKGKSPEVDLLTKLSADIDETTWENLQAHHERQALFCLSDNVELVAAAMAMARDEVNYIQKWLSESDMWKPTDEEIETWKEDDVVFNFLILQPYVLIKIKKDGLQ